MELVDAINTRRSIRKFTDYYVTDKELKTIMEAAQAAPSWANTQVWEFILVRDRGIIEKVTETYTPNNPARKGSFAASALIVVCAKQHVSGCRQGEPQTRFQEWFMFDLGMAVQNLCLRAHDMGLGTVVAGSLDHKKCNDILNVPEDVTVTAVVPVGKPLDIERQVPSRKELQEFVHLNVYGENYANIY